MFFLITLMILSSFIPNPPDPQKIIRAFHSPSDTTIMAEGWLFSYPDNKPLEMATIKINNIREDRVYETTTDHNGYYKYYGLKSGTYKATAFDNISPEDPKIIGKKHFFVPNKLVNGEDFICPSVTWYFLKENGQFVPPEDTNEYYDRYERQADYNPIENKQPRFFHFYLYDAKTTEPIFAEPTENVFRPDNGLIRKLLKSENGIYTYQVNRKNVCGSIVKSAYLSEDITINTTTDSLPSDDNIIYIPLISEEDKYKFYYYTGLLSGKVTSENSRYLPDSIRVDIKELGVTTYTSGKEGRFYIDKPLLGTYTFEFSHPEIKDVSWQREVVNRYDVHGAYFKVTTHLTGKGTQPTGKIYGIIRDNNSGQPVQGAKVEVVKYWNELCHTAYSDQNGCYLVRHLTPDNYTLKISKDNYDQLVIGDISIQPGPSNILRVQKDIYLTDAESRSKSNQTTIALRVINRDYNSPVEGYYINYINRNQDFVTDSTGIIYFNNLPPGHHDFLLHTKRFYTQQNYPEIRLFIPEYGENQPKVDTIWYSHYVGHPIYNRSDRIPLKGSVTDKRGKTISGAKITLFPYDYSIFSDENGEYDFLVPEGNYTIQVTATGYFLYEENIELVYEPNHINYNFRKNFILKKSKTKNGIKANITGYIYDSLLQRPQPGATVYLLDCDYSTVTDTTGFFSFTGVPTGIHELEVSDLGMQVFTKWIECRKDKVDTLKCYLNPIRFTNHKMNFKFKGKNGSIYSTDFCEIKGKVYYQPSGVSVAGTPVYLEDQNNPEENRYYCVTSRNGDLYLKVPPGDYTLKAKTPITNQYEKAISLKHDISDLEVQLNEVYGSYPINSNFNRLPPDQIQEITLVSNKTTDYNRNMGTSNFNFGIQCYDLAKGFTIKDCDILLHQVNANVSNDHIINMNNDGFTYINYAAFYGRSLGIYHKSYQTVTLNPNYYFQDEDLFVYLLPDGIEKTHYGEKVKTFYQTKYAPYSHWAPSTYWYFEYCLNESRTKNPHLQGQTTFIHGTPYIDQVMNSMSFMYNNALSVTDKHLINQYDHARFYITIIDGENKPVTRTITLRKNYTKVYPMM